MSTCLVLEGGAMRGMYTAAILDSLLATNIKIDAVIGVSAGALFGVNYVSKQKGRVLRYNKKYVNDSRYMGIKSLITTGDIVNKKFAFYELPTKLDKFDEEEFFKSKTEFYAVVTNIETGMAEYKRIINDSNYVEYLRASGSMPFVSKPVEIDGSKYLDGALGDSIPVLKAKEMGFDRVVVVLTRPIDYRKKKSNKIVSKLFYKKYPKLINAINNRYKVYNNTLDMIIEMEKNNEIFVIRPSKIVDIKRIEKDVDRLQEMYDLGIKDFKKCIIKLKKFLK